MRIHIHFSTTPPRAKSKVGDRRMLRGVEHVRVFDVVKEGPYRGMQVVSNGRPCFEWVPLDEAPTYLRDKPGRWVGKARPA